MPSEDALRLILSLHLVLVVNKTFIVIHLFYFLFFLIEWNEDKTLSLIEMYRPMLWILKLFAWTF